MAYPEPEVIPLIAEEQARDDEPYEAKSERGSRLSGRRGDAGCRSLSTILLASAFLVSLLSLLWNAVSFSSAFHTAYPPSAASRATRVYVESLRKPSIYLGLERVPGYNARNGHASASASASAAPSSSTSASVESQQGIPTDMARVSSRHPDMAFEQDGWVLLTEDDHTIMSFVIPPTSPAHPHATRCAFAGQFPRRWDLGLESPVQLLTVERDDDGVAGAPEIQFTSLSPSPTAPSSLEGVTWNTCPPAGRLLGALTAQFGTNATTAPFDCPSVDDGTRFMVDVGCLGGGCRVEYTYPDLSTPIGPSGSQHMPVPLGVTLIRV